MVGYTLVLINDAFTAANGVYTKKKLDANDLGKYGLLFYNAIFMLPFVFVWLYVGGDLQLVSNLSKLTLEKPSRNFAIFSFPNTPVKIECMYG